MGEWLLSPVDQFAALADATRCRVVEMLAEKARPVHELAAAFDISRPAISRHLRVLKEAGLVKEEKRGRENVYALQRKQLQPMQDWLEKHRAPAEKKQVKAKKPRAVPRPAPRPVDVLQAKRPVRTKPAVEAPPAPLPQLTLDF